MEWQSLDKCSNFMDPGQNLGNGRFPGQSRVSLDGWTVCKLVTDS